MKFVDWRGTEIKAGSVVVYPGRHSSSLWMNEGHVVEIEQADENDSWKFRNRPPERRYKLKIVKTKTNYAWQTVSGKRFSYPDIDRVTVIG